MPCKRENYLEWEEYFMAVAFLSAQRSKDPRTQVGACIVNKENKIVGIGYNGMPIGCNDDLMPWNRAESQSPDKWLNSKSPYVCHAELNAVLNKNMADVKGCVIYVALFPCNTCAQIIIQSGIKEVIYYSDKYHDKPEFTASRQLMDMAGVKYRNFRPRQKKIVIDFDCIGTTEHMPNGSSNSTAVTSSNDELTNQACHEVSSNNNIGKSRDNSVLHSQAEGDNPRNYEQRSQSPPLSVSTGERYSYTYSLASIFFIVCIVLLSWYGSDSHVG